MLIREMPTDIQQMLQEKIDVLSVKDAASAADVYFDQDGTPLHVNKAKGSMLSRKQSMAAPSHLLETQMTLKLSAAGSKIIDPIATPTTITAVDATRCNGADQNDQLATNKLSSQNQQ